MVATPQARHGRKGGLLLGAAQAGFAAGPMVALGFMLLFLFAEPDSPSPFRDGDLGSAIGILLLSVVYGFVPGFVATLLASWPLRSLGKVWPAARSPLTWALIGTCLPLFCLALLTDLGEESRNAWLMVLPFAASGFVCALIAWRQLHCPSPEH